MAVAHGRCGGWTAARAWTGLTLCLSLLKRRFVGPCVEWWSSERVGAAPWRVGGRRRPAGRSPTRCRRAGRGRRWRCGRGRSGRRQRRAAPWPHRDRVAAGGYPAHPQVAQAVRIRRLGSRRWFTRRTAGENPRSTRRPSATFHSLALNPGAPAALSHSLPLAHTHRSSWTSTSTSEDTHSWWAAGGTPHCSRAITGACEERANIMVGGNISSFRRLQISHTK